MMNYRDRAQDLIAISINAKARPTQGAQETEAEKTSEIDRHLGHLFSQRHEQQRHMVNQ